MAELCSQQDCTSCMACYNACPFGAISIVKTNLHALSPLINPDICRECGLCEKSCPILITPALNYPSAAIALYCKEEWDRTTCSSGGLATTLSRYIISKGGIVYGASAVGGYPEFRRITSEDDLELIKGSKYVYCDPALIYRSVKKDLTGNKKCLFIGLPCDVAGLKQYLHRDYDNLYTIDLVCHGTPPFDYLKAHIESKTGDYSNWNDITFRGKRDFCTTVFGRGGELIYSRNQYEDEYFAAFMRGQIYRPCCYECKFAQPERVSDITAGDFWGLGDNALDGYKGKVSLALLNTTMGAELFEAVKERFRWEQRTIEEALNGNHQLNRPTPFSPAAERFRTVYEKTESIEDAFQACGIKTLVRKNTIRRIVLSIPKKILNLIKNKD